MAPMEKKCCAVIEGIGLGCFIFLTGETRRHLLSHENYVVNFIDFVCVPGESKYCF